jgi:hypothetical protein
LTCYDDGCLYLGGQNVPDQLVYRDWLEDIDTYGFQNSDIAVFNNYCTYFTLYGGTVSDSFIPEILQIYFSK